MKNLARIKRLRKGAAHSHPHRPRKRPAACRDRWRSTDGTLELRRGDALELLAGVHDADAVLTDPPYGQTDCHWDQAPPLVELGKLIEAATKPAAVLALFAIQPFANDLITAWRKWFRYELVWKKSRVTGHLNANRQPLRQHELIVVFGRDKAGSCYTPQKTPGKPYVMKGPSCSQIYGRQREIEARVNHGDRHPTSVLAIDEPLSKRWHPTQKPVALCEWLVRTYTRPGDLVLDPFAGSASMAHACGNTGRRYLGFERDPQIFKRAVAGLAARLSESPAASARCGGP